MTRTGDPSDKKALAVKRWSGARAGNEIHATLEVGVTEVETVGVIVIVIVQLVRVETTMTQSEVRTCTNVRDPAGATARSWEGI